MELETIYIYNGIEFDNYLKNTLIVDIPLPDYLKASLESDDKDLCNGWDYLKTHLTPYLKNILLCQEYQDIKYNSKMVEYILSNDTLPDDLKKQLGSFVYVWKEIKRDCETNEQEQNLRNHVLKNGFVEIDLLNENHAKTFDGKRGECIMEISKIGLLGSFDEKQILKGRLVWSDHRKTLFLMPPKSRTKGYMIKSRSCYFKEE